MSIAKQQLLVLFIVISNTAVSTSFTHSESNSDFADSISYAIMAYELEQMPYYTIISYYDAVLGKECDDTTVVENGWSAYNHSIRTKCGISNLIDIKANDTIFFLESPDERYTGYYWNATSSVSIKERLDYDKEVHISMEYFDLAVLNQNGLIDIINHWDTSALSSRKCPQIKDSSPFRLTRVIVSDGVITSICGLWITLVCWVA